MSLVQLRDAGDVLAEIRMERSMRSDCLLVIEGETDSRFWRPRLRQPGCTPIIAGGRPTAEDAILRSEASGLRGVVAVVDADFDWIEGTACPSTNVIRTDLHDLETLLVSSPALDKVIAEFGDPGRVAGFVSSGGTVVRDAAVQRALPVGRLRLLNQRSAWNLDFDRFTVHRFIDKATWSFNEYAMRLAAVEEGVPLTERALGTQLSALHGLDPWQVCQGHDLVGVLSIGLSGVLGRKHGRKIRSVTPTQVASSLRLAYEAACLAGTRLYGDLRAWEAANGPFRLFPP